MTYIKLALKSLENNNENGYRNIWSVLLSTESIITILIWQIILKQSTMNNYPGE